MNPGDREFSLQSERLPVNPGGLECMHVLNIAFKEYSTTDHFHHGESLQKIIENEKKLHLIFKNFGCKSTT